MKFNSVKEYFYKLNSLGYQLMMIPLILLIIYYSQWVIKLPQLIMVDKEDVSGKEKDPFLKLLIY